MIIIIVVIIRHAFCGKLNAFFPTSWRWQLNHPIYEDFGDGFPIYYWV